MRTALETLKKDYRDKKLEDGLPIGGRNGRLTDDKIHRLTVCYGSAIRSNVNDLEAMKVACWSMYCSCHYLFCLQILCMFQILFVNTIPRVELLKSIV